MEYMNIIIPFAGGLGRLWRRGLRTRREIR